MRFDRFDLLARVREGHDRARFDLSSSDMPPQRLSEYGGLPDRTLRTSHAEERALRAELARLYGGGPEDYVITAGGSEANFAVFAAFLEPGASVLVEHPTYQPLEAIPKGLGARVDRVVRREEAGFRLDVRDVETRLDSGPRLVVLSNLNNPTGEPLEPEDVRALADLVATHDTYLVVDEIFRDLAFEHPTPTAGGLNDRTIVTSGVSKFYGAGGLRIGWIRAAPAARERIRGVLDYLSVNAAGPSVAIALRLLEARARTVARNRKLIESGRKIAEEWADASGIPWRVPVGHLAFPRVGGDTVRLAETLLRDHETFIAPGESFGLGGHFRLNIGMPAETLVEGLARVTKAREALVA